ncbi:MAG: type II secretion system F family protein [Aquificae bacterium]|nr:type II secretion system F family protein [Aquificota bacterium]
MPIYRYKAYNEKGNEISGVLEAPSTNHLRKQLLSKNIFPYEIKEITKEKKKFSLNLKLGKSIKDEELALLLYEIGLLLEKNVHITNILEILSKQAENQEIQNALLKAKSLIQEGKSIADAFQETGIFPVFLIEMIRAGETSGALDKIFLSASEFIEKQSEFKKNLVSSLIYPTIVIIAGFIAMIIIMTVVVPTITKIYQQFGRELPPSTKAVIIFSKFFTFLLKLSPIIFIGAVLAKIKFLKKEHIDKLKLKLPFFSKVYIYSTLSSWAKTLSLLLKGGITLDTALSIANKSIDNKIFYEKLNKVVEEIKTGKKLSSSLKETQIFTENIIQLIVLGEETGQLDEMLDLISNIYRRQTDRLISIFLSYLEPMTIIILAVMIGFFVFATLMPIMTLSVK